MNNWRSEYRRCEVCKKEYRPERKVQSYCKPECRWEAAYKRKRLLDGNPRSIVKRRLASPIPRSVENASFYSSKSIGCKPPQTPDIGAFVREQIVARAHLENPITIFLPDGSQGRVWLASKDGKKFIGDERHWRLNIAEAGRIDRLATARERKAWPVDVMGGQRMGKIDLYIRYGILTVEHRLVDDRPKALPLQGDDHALTYDANGYPELPHCLDRRTKPSLADAA